MTSKDKTLLDSIITRLQKAVILELSTIPPYLTALYSIIPGTNIEASKVIKGVALEEMLHMVLAANTLSALGGEVIIGKKNTPVYKLDLLFKPLAGKGREIEVSLQPFGEAALDTFLQIEMPEDLLVFGQAGFRATTVPGITVGDFYLGIIEDIKKLHRLVGKGIFSGNPDFQISEKYYWGAGGKTVSVTNIESAERAIAMIMDQGEGSIYDTTPPRNFDIPETVPHYFRFKELSKKRRYSPGSNRFDDPDGPEIDVNDKVYPLRVNAKHKDYKDGVSPDVLYLSSRFNNKYTQMLLQIEEGFRGNPDVFYSAIADCMREMAAVARELVQIKLNDNENAAPTFEWSPDFD